MDHRVSSPLSNPHSEKTQKFLKLRVTSDLQRKRLRERVMAGMLPGVELARRRRLTHHDSKLPRDTSSFQRLPRLQSAATAMDETALRARRRLEEKLQRGSYASVSATATAAEDGAVRMRNGSSSSCNQSRRSVVVVPEGEARAKEIKGFLRLQRWSSKLQRQKSQKEVCAICLDEFQTEQPVLNLPCCHKYHSVCLLPWLDSQSHCPYCRAHFHS